MSLRPGSLVATTGNRAYGLYARPLTPWDHGVDSPAATGVITGRDTALVVAVHSDGPVLLLTSGWNLGWCGRLHGPVCTGECFRCL